MRLSTALLLAAASSATATEDQKILGGQHQHDEPSSLEAESDSWWSSLESLWGEASDEIRAIWDEVAMIAPGALEDIVSQVKATTGSRPTKEGIRRPDSEWDFHLKGAEVGGDIVTQAGQRVDGDFDFSDYALRARHVDPSKLGVDTVKQYSGYLDAFEEDKHLFFCKSIPYIPLTPPQAQETKCANMKKRVL